MPFRKDIDNELEEEGIPSEELNITSGIHVNNIHGSLLRIQS